MHENAIAEPSLQDASFLDRIDKIYKIFSICERFETFRILIIL